MLFSKRTLSNGTLSADTSTSNMALVINVSSPRDPLKTTTGSSGQELMDPLKLEITFIANWIYRQQGPPSLSIKDNC